MPDRGSQKQEPDLLVAIVTDMEGLSDAERARMHSVIDRVPLAGNRNIWWVGGARWKSFDVHNGLPGRIPSE